jgi:hypothetical protein
VANDPGLSEMWSFFGVGDGSEVGLMVEYLAVGSHSVTLRLAPADAAGAAPFTCSPTIDGVATEDSATQTYTIPRSASPLWFPGARSATWALAFSTQVLTPDGMPSSFILAVETPITTELQLLWGDLLGTTDPASLCEMLAAYGVTCKDCLSDPTQTCLTFDISFVPSEAYTAGPIACVDEIECHPDCPTSTCANPNLGLCDPRAQSTSPSPRSTPAKSAGSAEEKRSRSPVRGWVKPNRSACSNW